MADYSYEFRQLGVHQCSHAARLAILWPVIGQVGNTTASQLTALAGLLGFWRARLSELKKLGWKKLESSRTMQYVRNCAPTMAWVTINGLGNMHSTCKLFDICPWCYARRLIAVHDKLSTSLSAVDNIAYARLEYKEQLTSFSDKEIRRLLNYYHKITNKIVMANADTSTGIYWVVNASPYVGEGANDLMIQINCGIIAGMPNSESLDLVPPDWTLVQEKATWEGYTTAIAKALRYPVGMLRGSPDMTLAILNAREGMRLTGSCGFFRNIDSAKEDTVEVASE